MFKNKNLFKDGEDIVVEEVDDNMGWEDIHMDMVSFLVYALFLQLQQLK